MRSWEDDFKLPPMPPGFELVAATRQPFGAALIFERIDDGSPRDQE
jgi:hypothetical protein